MLTVSVSQANETSIVDYKKVVFSLETTTSRCYIHNNNLKITRNLQKKGKKARYKQEKVLMERL